MELSSYTAPFEDGMRLKHNAKARLTVRSKRVVLQDDLIDAVSIGGALTLAGIVYNRASMSGGVSWWNPATGRPISRPKVDLRFRAEDILTGEQLCDCGSC